MKEYTFTIIITIVAGFLLAINILQSCKLDNMRTELYNAQEKLNVAEIERHNAVFIAVESMKNIQTTATTAQNNIKKAAEKDEYTADWLNMCLPDSVRAELEI